MRMLELNFNTTTTISKYAFNNTNSSTRSNHWTIKGPKTNKPPPAGTSFASLSCRMEDKAFLIALQYLHFHARSCWRFGWRNDDCIRAARMHFWLLLGCVDAGALLPSTVISLKCWEREREEIALQFLVAVSLPSVGSFSHLMPLYPPCLYQMHQWKYTLFLIMKHISHFCYMALFWKLDLRGNAQFLLTIITYVLWILYKYTD